MKKIISLTLALILCFSCLSVASFAADSNEVSQMTATTEEIQNPFEELLPQEEDETLTKIISGLSTVVTYIYNYMTQPEEPAVSLDTVLIIVKIVVSVVYGLYQSYQASNV